MDNKLIFKPTILTEYVWQKYNLNTTYTYYWQVFQAIADYQYRYKWNKYRMLPQIVHSWDKYSITDVEMRRWRWGLYRLDDDLSQLRDTPPNNNTEYNDNNNPNKHILRRLTNGDMYNLLGHYGITNYIKPQCSANCDLYIAIMVRSDNPEANTKRPSDSYNRYTNDWDGWIIWQEMITSDRRLLKSSVWEHNTPNNPITYDGFEIAFAIEDLSQYEEYHFLRERHHNPPFITLTAETRRDYYPDGNPFEDFYPDLGLYTYEGTQYYIAYLFDDEYFTTDGKGNFLGEIISPEQSDYPQSGVKDGYWYEYYGEVSTQYKYIYKKNIRFKKYKLHWIIEIPPNNAYDEVFYNPPGVDYPSGNYMWSFYWLYPDVYQRTENLGSLKLSSPERYREGEFEYKKFYFKWRNNTVKYYYLEASYPNSIIALPADMNIITTNEWVSGTYEKSDGFYDGVELFNAITRYGKWISGSRKPYGLQMIYNPDELDFFGEVYPPYTKPYYYILEDLHESFIDTADTETFSFRGTEDEILLSMDYTYDRTVENTHMGYTLEQIDTVSSNNENAYPQDGVQEGFYYIFDSSEAIIIGYHKGEKLRDTSSSNGEEYPREGYMNDEWFSYSHSVPHYSKGQLVGTATSYIETTYPSNSYVIGDAWYVYLTSRQITVGELEINKSKLMGGVNYTQEINPSEDLQIGTPGAAQIDFTIFAPDASAATQYLGKDFTYYVKMNSDTDWRQIGTFTLTKAELPDKQTAKIQGFDYIYKFDTIIDEWLDEQTFPMTLGEMFASLCEYVGCEAYSTDFTNSDFQVNDNFEAVQITGRTILQYITEASGGFCVAEPDGRIHLKHYAIPPTGAVNLGNNSYRKYTHEIYNVPVISSVVVRKDDDDEGVESNV